MRLFFILFISFFAQTNSYEYFKKPFNFNAEIIINNAVNFVSQGNILFRNGTFIYNLDEPYKQTIASDKDKLYIQDDDFQQVIIYDNKNTFFLQDLLNNEYKSEDFSCPNTCFKLLLNENSSFQEALVVLDGDIIDWIRLIDIKGQRIFIEFENFKFESSKITYVIPENYEIIKND